MVVAIDCAGWEVGRNVLVEPSVGHGGDYYGGFGYFTPHARMSRGVIRCFSPEVIKRNDWPLLRLPISTVYGTFQG